MIDKNFLMEKYIDGKMSMKDIAGELFCSVNKVQYWMDVHGIERRSRSESLYVKHNPHGDPFTFSFPKDVQSAILYGIGVGLYWGEGNKKNKASIRLGNSDPLLVDYFIIFLEQFFKIRRSELRFSLQIFSDMKESEALNFWVKKLRVSSRQFSKTTITRSGSVGTYREKNKTGVLIVYFHNIKARDKIISLLPTLPVEKKCKIR